MFVYIVLLEVSSSTIGEATISYRSINCIFAILLNYGVYLKDVGHDCGVFCKGQTCTFATLSPSIDMSSQATEDITHCCCHCQYPNLLLVGDYYLRERESGKPILSQRLT